MASCPSVSAHPANRIRCSSNIAIADHSLANLFFQTPLDRRGMASLQSNCTFSFKHHLTGEAWPAFIQTPLDRRGMASLQSKSTFFNHHLTGEAWPACRAIVPLQTPLDRRGTLGMVYVYVRTSTIAKNRHLNIVLRAELYLRTGTYDRRRTWPKPWRSTPIHV